MNLIEITIKGKNYMIWSTSLIKPKLQYSFSNEDLKTLQGM